MQEKLQLKTEIEAELIRIKRLGLDDEAEIGRRLGYSDNPIPKLERENYYGSTQLLSGLRLLKRVIELENQPPPKTNRELILELAERVAAVERRLPPVAYPPHRAQGLVLNESGAEVSCGPEPDPEFLALARRSMEILGVPFSTPPATDPK